MNLLKYAMGLVVAVALTACGGGGGSGGTPSSGTGSTTSSTTSSGTTTTTTAAATALFTSAPDSLTLTNGATSPSYNISGGVAPYTVNTDMPALLSVSVNGSVFTVVATSGVDGAGSVVVTDAAGTKKTFVVTVPKPTALYINMPSSFALSIGTTNFITVSGGVPLTGASPYVVNNNNSMVVQTILSGSTLSVRGLSAGTASVAISDSKGSFQLITITVPTPSALYSDAPASLTLISGTGNTYTIFGGVPLSGSYGINNSDTTVTSASITGSTLIIKGLSAGVAALTINDAVGASTTITVTVPAPGALISTAPSSLTLAIGQSSAVYAISGAVPNATAPSYNAVSTNTALVTTSLNATGTQLTINAVSGTNGGTANVIVSDSKGATLTIAVTVPAPVALFTTAPSTLAISAGGSARNFAIFGGTAPYSVVNSNPTVASGAIPLGTSLLNITGAATGSTSIIVSDFKGATVTIAVVVTSPGPLLTSAASSVTIAKDLSDTFTVNGGSPGYSVSSSNNAVAIGTIVSGVNVKIEAKSAGTATIVVSDSLGNTVSIAVTVPAPGVLYTTAPGTLNITKSANPFSYAIVGGYPIYSASSSDPGVVSASVSVDGLGRSTLNISAVNGGVASVVVTDSQSQKVTIQVNVGSSTALFSNASKTGTINLIIGQPYTYIVNGGTILESGGGASYWVTNTNASVVSASFVGPVLTVTGLVSGTATVHVTDAVGAILDINFTVGSGSSGGGTSTSYPTLTPALQTSAFVATSSIDATSYTLLKVTLKDPSNAAIPNQVISVAADLTKLSFPEGSAALTDVNGIATIKIARANLLATGAGALTVTYDYKPGMIAAYSGGGIPPSTANVVTTYVGYQVTTANITLTNLDVGALATMKAYGTQQVTVIANVNGSPATSTPVTVSFTATCGQVSPTTASTDSVGKVLVTYSATDATGITPSTLGCSGKAVQITASTSGAAAVSQSLAVTAAPATSMSFVSASPTRIYLANSGGVTQSMLTFQLLNQSGEGIAGQDVQLTLKSLNGGTPKAAFDTLGGIAPVVLTTDNKGKVSQAVYSGSIPTNVIVNAALVSVPSIQSDSSVLAIASGRPVQSRLSLALEKFAIEGFQVDGTTTNVTLNLSDRQGNPVPDGTVVNFVTEGGVMIPPSCTTGTVAGNSTCSVTIRSQGTRPANGLITILAYVAGEEDFTDSNGNNVYDCGEPFADLGIAYRDNSMVSAVVPPYSAANVGSTVPRNAEPSACGFTSVTPNATTPDGVWGAADVRKQAVIVFATSGAVITQSFMTSTSLTFTVADGNINSMPTGSVITVGSVDNSPLNNLACTVVSGGSTAVPNTLSPLMVTAYYSGCVAGDLITVSVASPLGTVTSAGYTVP